jgi:hypothetical protein
MANSQAVGAVGATLLPVLVLFTAKYNKYIRDSTLILTDTVIRQWFENLVQTLCYQVQQQITAFEDNTS